MDAELADELVDNLCTEVYKSEDGVCLVLVGKRSDNKIIYTVRGVCCDVYELDDMVHGIHKYQLDQYYAVDKNGIPHLTGIKVGEELEKKIDGE